MDGDRNHDADFHAWANEQATLLRAGRLSEIDVEHIAEEIETLGRGEKRELVSRLSVLLLHLLRWAYQPERRGNDILHNCLSFKAAATFRPQCSRGFFVETTLTTHPGQGSSQNGRTWDACQLKMTDTWQPNLY